MTDFTTTPIFCNSQSGDSDGTTTTLNGATITLGTNVGANGLHGWFRFATGAVIPTNEVIVDGKFVANIENTVTPVSGFELWASEFGTGAPANADYNKAASNVWEGGATGTLRVKLGEIIAAQAYTTDDEISYPVPSRFIRQGGSEISDFEIRPDVAGVPAAGHTATVYGAGELVETASIARLTGYSLEEAEIRVQNAYRFQSIGAESFLAIGVETTAGTMVKPNVLLDMVSSSLDGQAENIRSEALSRQRARPRKMAVGREGASGTVNIELTPERWMVLLLGMMKLHATVDLGVIDGIQTYEHEFRVAKSNEIYTFTGLQKNGPFFQAFPGLTVGAIDISADLDRAVTANVEFAGRSEYLYDIPAAGGADAPNLLASTAAYDSVDNAFYTFVGAAMSFDGLSDTDGRCINRCSITIRQNVNEKRGFTRKRGIQGHYVGGFEVGVSFSGYFENEEQVRKFLGVSHKSFPFTAEQSVEFQALSFSFAGVQGVDLQEMLISVPKMVYNTIRKPINNEDAIMLEADASGVVDSGVEGNLTIKITNAQTASFFNPLTTEITVLPEGV